MFHLYKIIKAVSMNSKRDNTHLEEIRRKKYRKDEKETKTNKKNC